MLDDTTTRVTVELANEHYTRKDRSESGDTVRWNRIDRADATPARDTQLEHRQSRTGKPAVLAGTDTAFDAERAVAEQTLPASGDLGRRALIGIRVIARQEVSGWAS